MDKPRSFTINIDGAARGNPGPAAFAFVITHDGQTILEGNGRLGSATNNVAEYTALVKALEKAAELKGAEILIRSDSELLVRQMNGEYRVKNEKLVPLFREANRLRDRFQSVRFTHVPREKNREADRLCNEALDRPAACPRSASPSSASSKGKSSLFSEFAPADWQDTLVSSPSPGSDWDETIIEAEQILRAVGKSWLKFGLERPSPSEVIQKIIQLLESRGFLRP